MSDVFNEVDEELRRDKASELFTRYRPLMIAVTLAIVLGVSGFKGWQWYSLQKQARAAESFNAVIELLKKGDLEAADKALGDFVKSAPKGYVALALMEQAAVKVQQGKAAEAAQLYTQASTQFNDPLYQDLAALKAVMAVADELTLGDLDAKLAPLAGPGRPFRFTARELLAAKAFEEGDLSRARDEYNYLSFALDAPTGARTRAGQALALLGPAPEVKPATQDEAGNTSQTGATATNTEDKNEETGQ